MAVTTALALVVTVSSLAQGATPTTKRVSVRSNGTQANGSSYRQAISGNGRFVAFDSSAKNLVAGDTNGVNDVFVHDRETKKTKRVSVRSNGTQADEGSYSPAISGNGRFVAFSSYASNLVAGDSNGTWDVFVHDRETKETRRVSVGSNGAQADGYSNVPAISGNGRFVSFESDATNLVADDTNHVTDVFVHDWETNETMRVSVGSNGAQADEGSGNPAISGNGRFVAFVSAAANLVADDTNHVTDVFVHDRETNETKRVSVGLNGAQGDGDSYVPAISGDGRFVAFFSFATNLVAGDTTNRSDVFVRGPL